MDKEKDLEKTEDMEAMSEENLEDADKAVESKSKEKVQAGADMDDQ